MLQNIRCCSDHSGSLSSYTLYQKIGLALICTVFAFLTPTSDAFAVSKEEQRRCFEYANQYAAKFNVRLDKRVARAIRHYCMKGDTRGAKRVVASHARASAGTTQSADPKSCVMDVRAYAAKLNVKLDRATAKRVAGYCRRGDIRSAKRVVASHARASADTTQSADPKSCVMDVRAYAKRLNVRLDRNTAKRVAGYCRRGDIRSALRMVRSQAGGSGKS